MADQFISVALTDIIVGEELPAPLYIYLDFRFITFRAAGDRVDRITFDRLQFKKVKTLFIQEADRDRFFAWAQKQIEGLSPSEFQSETPSSLSKVRQDTYRRTLDIFQANHPDKMVQKTVTASKKLVLEVMKVPYALQSLSILQTYSRGTVDHSVNVSVLSVYLAMHMGYTHNVILQHVGMGGLLHDVGKTLVPILDSDTKEDIEEKMKDHPLLGLKILENQASVPKEVKMIIAQHHEHYDGTGYPKGLRGGQVYDLARIVSIANAFDELVGETQGSLLERQKYAMKMLEERDASNFDPNKLNKALKILKFGV